MPDLVGWLVGSGVVAAGWGLFVRLLFDRISRLERMVEDLAAQNEVQGRRLERLLASCSFCFSDEETSPQGRQRKRITT